MAQENTPIENITIIGAGIVGISSAIWAQRAGYDVTLIDRLGPLSSDPTAQTSYGNGGLLTPSYVVPVMQPGILKNLPKMLLDKNSPLFVRWSYVATHLPWMLKFLSHARTGAVERASRALTLITHDCIDQHLALAEGTGAAKYIEKSDMVYAYPSRSEFEEDRFIWEMKAKRGFGWQELNGSDFATYDRVFADALDFAICEKDNGFIKDPGAYVKTLTEHFLKQGGTLIAAQALGFEKSDGKVTGVRTDKGLFACDHLVVSAGAWSTDLAQALGTKVKVESERGYHIELDNPSIVPRSPTVIMTGGFVVTPMNGRLRCAGTIELGGINTPRSRAPFELLKRQVHEALPGLKYDAVHEWMGHRPVTVDSIPVVGATGAFANAYLGFGHHSIGLTGGPKTGRTLIQLISGQLPNQDLSLLSPARFER